MKLYTPDDFLNPILNSSDSGKQSDESWDPEPATPTTDPQSKKTPSLGPWERPWDCASILVVTLLDNNRQNYVHGAVCKSS